MYGWSANMISNILQAKTIYKNSKWLRNIPYDRANIWR